MKLAIMQPYLFPYIGYFQLIQAVDTFVVYDDVNFIKQGWINRNNILVNGKKQLMTLELLGASSNRLINEVRVGGNRGKLLKTILQAYCKAPYFGETYPVIEQCINNVDTNLATFVGSSLQTISEYLGITTTFITSSTLEKDNSLKAQDKVISIGKVINADTYVNAMGGKELYSTDDFKKNGIDLYFIETHNILYSQFNNDFVPNLSIIDLMMFNSLDRMKKILQLFNLVR